MTHEHSSQNGCSGNCSSCGSNSSCSSSSCGNNCQQSKPNGLEKVKHKIAVLSGKGGVGKSTVATNLALALAKQGLKVGLLDVDIHGPSIPTLFNLQNEQIMQDATGLMQPVESHGLKIISIGFFLENHNDALIWRGPMKMTVINQFLNEVNWGELDALVIDLPPGTGDEPLSIGQSFSNQDGAVVVTTPQEMAMADVRKSMNFCQKLGIKMFGIIENMSGFICPKCHEITHIFGTKGGESLAENFNVPLLAQIPLDPAIGMACDNGKPYVIASEESPVSQMFSQVATTLSKSLNLK